MPTKQPKPIQAVEEFRDIHFPKAGIDLSFGFQKQPNRPTGKHGVYARTCAVANNVRGFEATTNRSRGGQRPGHVKYIPLQVAGEEFVVQHLGVVAGVGYAPPGGGMQLSQAGRVVTLVAVSEGRVFAVNAGETVWTEATNNTGETPPLNFTGLMFSAPNQQRLYFVDGINAVVYIPSSNTVELWTATAGSFPVDSDGNLPRLICTWRGRTVLSGLLLDSQNIFMSRVDNPTDFDYSPVSPSAVDAIALNLSPLGLIGDVVTCMIPFSDDVLVIGGDHTIWAIRGDPLAGGQTDLISSSIGMAWGEPYCIGPDQNIYFFSNRCGIFMLSAGQQGAQPQRISQAIEQILQEIDTGSNSIRLLWDDRWQGFHVFVTPLDEPSPTTHFFYEQRSGAWFTDTYPDDMNPLTCVVFDGNLPGDRVPLIGSWDGFVRSVSPDAEDDDGITIESTVVIGPLLTRELDELLVKDLQAVLSTQSNEVEYEILVGESAEEALASEPVESGVWGPSRNLVSYVRRSGHAVYIRIKGGTLTQPRSSWALEVIRARVAARGKVRQRSQ